MRGGFYDRGLKKKLMTKDGTFIFSSTTVTVKDQQLHADVEPSSKVPDGFISITALSKLNITVVPGSHDMMQRLPEFLGSRKGPTQSQAEITERVKAFLENEHVKLPKKVVKLKAGQTLMMHPFLLHHGGKPDEDMRSHPAPRLHMYVFGEEYTKAANGTYPITHVIPGLPCEPLVKFFGS